MTEGKDCHKRVYNLNDVVTLLEEQDFQEASIYVTPPIDGASDEDSGEEDTGTIDNVPGSQLRAQAEGLFIQHGGDIQQIGMSESEDSSSDMEEDQLPQLHHRPRPRTAVQREWVKEDIPEDLDTQRPWPQFVLPPFLLNETTPIQLFNLFFDDEVMELLAEMTQLYAFVEKADHAFTIDVSEMRLFLSILLISGYAVLPRRRMYWEDNDDCHIEAVSSAMSRNRFDEIFKYLHIADNGNLCANDKFAKVRPLLSMINERCLLYAPDEQHLAIDESMVPYYGRHSAKQFIRGKPVRFGFKYWVLATSTGYSIQFEPYQGASTSTHQQLGLGGSVVVDLLAELPQQLPYHLIFDNFFTSLKLLDCLSEMGVAGTGTVRSNRVEKCPLKAPKQMTKEPRGSMDYALDRSKKNLVTIWNDNNAVMLASNAVGIHPISHATRWSRKERRRIEVAQPDIVKYYNRYMGGVDRLDQNIASYRISMRSKKWWWASFAYMIDMAMQNAWLLYRMSTTGRSRPLDLLAFRRDVVHMLLIANRRPRSVGRPVSRSYIARNVAISLRTDGYNHYQSHMPTQRRCAECGKNTRRSCKKCGVGLHLHCFEVFHKLI